MILSVVVPLYNTEKYVSKCLDSLLNQGLDTEQYEIIVVNDGSTDKGPEIVQSYCDRYKNIRLISQENAGVSVARNRGIKEAHGEYIHFVDSDDYMEPGAYSHIFYTLLNGSLEYDIIKFHATTVDCYFDSNKILKIKDSIISFGGTHGEHILKYKCFSFGVWNLLIRRDVLSSNNIFFPVGVTVSEDIAFNVELATLSDLKVMACNTNAYRYVVREGSAITSFSDESISKSLYSYRYVYDVVKEKSRLYSVDFDKMFKLIYLYLGRQVVTRLLSSNFSYSRVRNIKKEYYQIGLLPIDDCSKMNRALNTIIKNNVLFYLTRVFYRMVFLPYLKRFIGRN